MNRSLRVGPRRVVAALLLGTLVLGSGRALAEVIREGSWPASEPKVSLSAEGLPRAEAVKRLAEKAGWSVVIQSPSSTPVDVQVKDQPADKVLEILLSDGRYVAKRDGDLIAISPADVAPADAGSAAAVATAAAAADAAPAPAPAPATPTEGEQDRSAEKKGEDRVVTGGSTRVEKDEVVHDLVVMGGSAEVLGKVTGDLAVMGGSAVLRKGARVRGDASVLGGSLDVEDGAHIDGEVGVLGGKVRRGDDVRISLKMSDDDAPKLGTVARLVDSIGSAITRTALLFVFGTVLLALGGRRMEAMQTEVAARPMRSFALGVVGVLVFAVAAIALCVTVVGIPVAVLGALLGAFGAYAGICAVLATAGGALVQHRSKSPYVHLAVGCLVYLVASSIPWLGGFVTAAVVLIGIGALVATRGAGFFHRKLRDEGPYRTAAA